MIAASAVAFSHAKATEQISVGGEPRWLAFDSATREIPINLYAEMLRDRGLTDLYEIVRVNKCGWQRAIHWAAFLGLAAETNDGLGSCFAITSPVKGVNVDRFIARFDGGESVSSALKSSGSSLVKLMARFPDLTVVPSAVRGNGKLEDVKAWRLGELVKMQATLESAALEFIKRRAEHPDAFSAVIEHYSSDDFRYPPGKIPAKQAAVWWFLRRQGVSKKKAFTASVPFGKKKAEEPLQAISVAVEPEAAPKKPLLRDLPKVVHEAGSWLDELPRGVVIGGLVLGVAAIGAAFFKKS